jgi:NADH-quinone oxidoreductase subunit N
MKELLITSLLGIAILAFDIIKLRKAVFPIIILGLLATIGSCVIDWNMNENPFNNNMLLMDNYSLAFTAILSSVALLWFLLTSDHFKQKEGAVDLYALVAFSLSGAVILTSYTNMVMLFLGIEILSIPMYVLAASNKKSLLSNEAGFKYFFLGSMASAILLFGIALVYGATGSFDLSGISTALTTNGAGSMLTAGVLMILVAFAFKVSIAPFQFWTPDVYQGAPTPITALMATLVKAAGFAALFRLFGTAFTSTIEYVGPIIVVLAAITLLVSNVLAAIQTNTKRLLAYSSISHAGFMFAALAALKSISPQVLMYYIIVYSIASLTSFIVLEQVSSAQGGNEGIDAFKGLAKRNPVMAGAMTLSLLSMAGIPPLGGFMAKYFVISAMVDAGQIWLVIIMILTSAIAVYYYLKVIIAMFTPIENAGRIVVEKLQYFMFILFSVALIAAFFLAALV